MTTAAKDDNSSRSYTWKFNLQRLQQQPIKATFAEQQLLLQNVHWECSSQDWQQPQAAADQTLATTSVTVQAAEPRGSSRPVALQSLHCLTIGARNMIMAKRCSRASANGLARAPRSCDDLASVITKKGRPMEKPWRRNEGQGRAPLSRALTLH